MSEKQIIFLCSLPGAGGLLLQSILSQNPAFCTLGHSPFFELFHGIANLGTQLSKEEHSNTFISNILYGLLNGASDFAQNRTLVDKTGTGALAYYKLLKQLKPDIKIILFVRDLRAQLCNLLLRLEGDEIKNALTAGALLNENAVIKICEQPTFAIGIKRIIDFIHSESLSNIFIASYEQLCLTPHATIALLYEFLELPQFEHKFNDLKQIDPDLCFGPIQYQSLIFPKLSSTNYRWPCIFSKQASDLILSTYKNYFSILYPDALTANPFNIKAFASQETMGNRRL